MVNKADGLYFIRQQELDLTQWDACLDRSPHYIIYAQSWYLNVVCAQWQAVVEIKAGKYVSLFPLPEKKWLNYRKIYQPFFTQQLGLFTTADSNFLKISEYILTIPPVYQDIYIQLNTSNTTGPPVENSTGFTKFYRQTFHLDLSKSYPEIYKQYKTNQKRNLSKAAGLQIKISGNIDGLIFLFIQEKGEEVPELKKKDYRTLKYIYTESVKRNVGFIYEAHSENGLEAAAFLLKSKDSFIFLFGASSETGKRVGAMSWLLDFVIQQEAGKLKIFDFEGSDKPSLAKFYANFGAKPVQYVSLVRKQTPWYIKWLSR